MNNSNNENLFNQYDDPFARMMEIFEVKEENKKSDNETIGNLSGNKTEEKEDFSNIVFKNKEALREIEQKRKNQELAALREGEDQFDRMIRILNPEGKKIETPKPVHNKNEYGVPVIDDEKPIEYEKSSVNVDLFSIGRNGDSDKVLEYFGYSRTKEEDVYDRIKNNSTGVNDKVSTYGYSKSKRKMSPALKGLIGVATAVMLIVGVKGMVKSVDNHFDNMMIDQYGIATISSISHYDYDNVFTSDSGQMSEHVQAAQEFYDNTGDYLPQYRTLSIYQTYKNVKTNNRLQMMDYFLNALKYESVGNSTLGIQISRYDCFLDYALSVVEQYEGKEITKYDSVIEKYKEVRDKYPGEQPYQHLNDFNQNDIEELMEKYRECSNNLYEEFIHMERSGGPRR